MPEISIIIANWNGKHFLHDCLTSLRQQTFHDFETILVDNGSSDGSVEYVRADFPEVRIVALDRNLGFTGGSLAGYEVAEGSLIVLLNNDTEAHPNWLAEIHRGSLDFPSAGSFASKMMYFNQRSRIENCGFMVSQAGTTAELGRDEINQPEWDRPRSVFGACAGAAAYRRSMLHEIGFLDPDFFMIYEDVDFSFRAQLAGYDCMYLPKAIVYHRYRSTIKKQPAKQVYYAQRNIEFVYWKNMPAGLLLRCAPQRLLYELGAALFFFTQGAGVAFLRAKIGALKMLPAMLRKRRTIQESRVRNNAELLHMLRSNSLVSKLTKFLSIAGRRYEAALK